MKKKPLLDQLIGAILTASICTAIICFITYGIIKLYPIFLNLIK